MADNLPNKFMAEMTYCGEDQLLSQVLKEIDLLPQPFFAFIVSNDRTVISLNSQSYSRSISSNYLSFVSDFFSTFLRNSHPFRICSVCLKPHGQNELCLPNNFDSDSVDLLFDILEWKVGRYLSFSESDLVSLVRLCGFLLIRTEILHAFLVQLLPVREVKFSQSGPMFVYELYRNGFLKIAQLYSQGVVHPNFYSVLQTCPSYRQVKRKLHSFQRFDKFARRDAFPSGRFRFPIWDSGKEECLFPP